MKVYQHSHDNFYCYKHGDVNPVGGMCPYCWNNEASMLLYRLKNKKHSTFEEVLELKIKELE